MHAPLDTPLYMTSPRLPDSQTRGEQQVFILIVGLTTTLRHIRCFGRLVHAFSRAERAAVAASRGLGEGRTGSAPICMVQGQPQVKTSYRETSRGRGGGYGWRSMFGCMCVRVWDSQDHRTTGRDETEEYTSAIVDVARVLEDT